MKNRLWMLLAVMAVFAVPSFAQFSPYQEFREISPDEGGTWAGASDYQQGQYLDNPCTAVQDWVWVNYSAYVQGEQTAAGVDQYMFTENTTMAGSYAASGTTQSSDVGYSTPFSLRQYHKVNTPDNFHVVTVINFDPAAYYTYLTVETACGDGTPGSAQ